MRLYRQGDQGEPVRDIQGRLFVLEYDFRPDGDGTFGRETAEAVRRFQADKGLAPDGIVGDETWQTLVAAGYKLGDRQLTHRAPMMRGDDVAELQRSLNALGFASAKVDGIFGQDTLAALLDFQHNRGMAEDGIAGPAVASELELMARATSKEGREAVRERQWLLELPDSVVGQIVYIDAFTRNEHEAVTTWKAAITLKRILQDLGSEPVLSRRIDTRPPERVRALRANRLGVDFIVSFALEVDDEPGVYYFASPYSHSAAGQAMASTIGRVVDLPTAGRALPMLIETRSPAVVVTTNHMDEKVGGRVAQGIINFLASDRDDHVTFERAAPRTA